MNYAKIILLSRLLIYVYRCWHFYESNKKFVRQIKQSKTYNSFLSIHKYTAYVKECSNINAHLPYLLRLSEFENRELYISIYKVTKCIHDPAILTNKFMESTYVNDTLNPLNRFTSVSPMNRFDEINEIYKMSNDFNYFSKKLLLSDFITMSEHKNTINKNKIEYDANDTNVMAKPNRFYHVNTIVYIYKETVKHLFYAPTHTPLYDTMKEIHQNMKLYYRYIDESYRHANYLAIDIIDEVQIFTIKFKVLIKSSIDLYYSTGFLLSEIAGYIYGNDNLLFITEGVEALCVILL